MTSNKYFTSILLVLSVVGMMLNANQMVEGFVFWLVANAGWVIYNFKHRFYAQGILFIIYFVMCIYGLFAWT